MRYRNRIDAGRELARHLTTYEGRSDVVVLGLPRGGVPVAAEVAVRLRAPLDVFLVRKLGVPGHPELAMGAIAEGGVKVLSHRLIRDLGIPSGLVDRVAARERLELDRHDALFRAGRQRQQVAGLTVIVVDDGLATGATMEATIVALREQKPSQIVVAAPVGAKETCARLSVLADDVVCPLMPDPFSAVGMWYDDFNPTTDDEVRRLLSGETSGAGSPSPRSSPAPVDVVRRCARPLTGDIHDYDSLLDGIGEARVVLIGEATHGTHEFYRHRALITGRLIREKGFRAVAVEADWPDAYRVNRYVRGVGPDRDAVESLADFRRFPAWMWRNADVLDFIGWLRAYNDQQPEQARAGFYGLDLYSLRASAEAVLSYLQKVDPEAAVRAQRRYACFDRFGDEMQAYAYTAGSGLSPSCENEVVSELIELRRRAADYAARDGRIAADEYFVAEQNARVVRNAEEYYRTMLAGRVESWNLRDRHMADTLRELRRFLGRSHPGVRVVVWAHNSHLGDARATELGPTGELNLGQLVREESGAEAVLVGLTTHTGTVTAAAEWDGPALRRHVRPSVAGSYERLFHETGLQRFLLPLRTDPELRSLLRQPRLERAIGVIYAPRTERRSHYFHAQLPDQFDFVLHFDETRAVEPLERTAAWETAEVAETFPSGL
ncbi:MAG: erythromycin esterase family protein [Acidobacteriota bacterium]